MPRYVFHNPTQCRIYIPGVNVWISPQKNLIVDTQANLLDNPYLNTLVLKKHLRMSETVESPLIANSIEIPVVDMLGAGGGAAGIGWDRIGILLAPTADPRVFLTPSFFIHTAGQLSIEVFHQGGGRRLEFSVTGNPGDGDYVVEESGGAGTGYDTVRVVSFTPKGILANYKAL